MLDFLLNNVPVNLDKVEKKPKVSMPAILRAIISIKVIPTYIIHKNFAVSRTLGLIFISNRSGTALKNGHPTPKSGNIAI